jgi:hypothetical protein
MYVAEFKECVAEFKECVAEFKRGSFFSFQGLY